MTTDKLPPFGQGRIAARYERERDIFDEMGRRYESWRADLFRKMLAAATHTDHDPGDEDRSER